MYISGGGAGAHKCLWQLVYIGMVVREEDCQEKFVGQTPVSRVKRAMGEP